MEDEVLLPDNDDVSNSSESERAMSLHSKTPRGPEDEDPNKRDMILPRSRALGNILEKLSEESLEPVMPSQHFLKAPENDAPTTSPQQSKEAMFEKLDMKKMNTAARKWR